MKIDKRVVVRRILDQLLEQLHHLAGASRTMHADASDEQNKPEDKYDTRALETSYLASAQARQATEIELALAAYQKLELRSFANVDPIDLTALVEIAGDGGRTLYFIGPRGGGLEVQEKGSEILVITPESPLGEQLMGKKAGDRIRLETRGPSQELRIVSVG